MNTFPKDVVCADGTIINTDPGAEKTTVNASNVGDDGSTTDALRFTPGDIIDGGNGPIAETVTTAQPIDKEQEDADRQAYLDGLSGNPGNDINYLDPDFDFRQAYLLNNNGGG